VDLSPLQIDRAAVRPKRGGRRGGPNWVAITLVAVALVAFWLFRAPLLALLDRVRLPEVEVGTAIESTPLAAGAIEGTAANGYVVADRKASLSADTPGRIVEMNVREGSLVKKGDVVARLYSDEVNAGLERAKADVAAQQKTIERTALDEKATQADVARSQADADAAAAAVGAAAATKHQAELSFERVKNLVDQQIETAQALDDARATLDRAAASLTSAQAQATAATASAAEAAHRAAAAAAAVAEAQARLPVLQATQEQAQATLDKMSVRAPFTGIVVLKDAEVGEVVSPNAQGSQSRGSVATMVDLASLEVEVEMPERNISAVKVGAPAKIFLDAYPGQPYTGKVERIWPIASRDKATIEVRVQFDQLDEKLRPEMGARVVFLPKEGGGEAAAPPPQPGVYVPARAFLRVAGREGVFVVERDTVRFVELKAGEERNGKRRVESGLKGGERVVLDPPARLADGDRVRIKES
jgi:HlyD family secretion protein